MEFEDDDQNNNFNAFLNKCYMDTFNKNVISPDFCVMNLTFLLTYVQSPPVPFVKIVIFLHFS